MFSDDRRVAARITAEEADRLTRCVERGDHTRAWLIGQIVRQWLDNPRRKLPRDRVSGEPGRLTPQQLERVKQRESVLALWKEMRISASRRGITMRAVTDQMIMQLAAKCVHVSRAIL
jgi:hypothetical protein